MSIYILSSVLNFVIAIQSFSQTQLAAFFADNMVLLQQQLVSVYFDKQNQPFFKNYLPAYGVKGALQNERVSCLLVDSKKKNMGRNL